MKLNYDLKKGMSVEVKNTSISVFDSNGNEIYYEDGDNYWIKYGYDSNGNQIYFKNSRGIWYKQEYDDRGNKVYYQDSYGNIVDKRPKTKLTKEECNFIKCFTKADTILISDAISDDTLTNYLEWLKLYFGNGTLLLETLSLSNLSLEFKGLERGIKYKVDELEVTE